MSLAISTGNRLRSCAIYTSGTIGASSGVSGIGAIAGVCSIHFTADDLILLALLAVLLCRRICGCVAR